jgi:glycosyltransferase involved in cell wall biosynthesis
MRIGLINEYFPPFAPGGAEWSSLALAEGLAQNHDVRVITPNYGSEVVEMMGHVEVRRFPSPVKLTGKAITVHMRWLANPRFYQSVAAAIMEAAAAKPFDILHVQAKYSLPGAYWAARRLGVPLGV